MRKTLMVLTIAGIMGGLSAVHASPEHDHNDGKSMSHEEHTHDAGMKHDDHGSMKHDGMNHGDHDGMKHADIKHEAHADNSHKMDGMFLEKKQIDGYDVSFHVMKPADGPSMGGTHHVMIKVEKDGKPVDGVVINSKVVYPDGESDSKKTMKMGGWYMAGYNMHDSGKHQLMILFKTPDGKKHKGGIYYP